MKIKIKNKEKIFKAARENSCIANRVAIRMTTDFLLDWKLAGDGNTSLKGWRKKKSQPRILYLVKKFFKTESEIKIFSDKSKLNRFFTSRLSPQEILKDIK